MSGVTAYFIIFALNLFAGAIATFGIGVALDHLSLNLILVFVAILAADTVSDTIYYLLGRFASQALRTRIIGRSKKSASRFRMMERYYSQHGASTIFLGKMSDILAVPAVLLTGVTKMPYRFYILICTATSILKTAIILTAGYLLSKSTNTADAHFVVYGIGGVFLIVLIVVFARQFYTMVKKESAGRTTTR